MNKVRRFVRENYVDLLELPEVCLPCRKCLFQCMGVPISSHSHQQNVLSYFCQFDRWEIVSLYFHCISLILSEFEYFSICLRTILKSFFVNCLFLFSPNFFYWFFGLGWWGDLVYSICKIFCRLGISALLWFSVNAHTLNHYNLLPFCFGTLSNGVYSIRPNSIIGSGSNSYYRII